MKLISSFKALDFSRAPVKIYDPEDRGLHSTWFQSGLLVVGGPTMELNVWDCPAEQRLRVGVCQSKSRTEAKLICEQVFRSGEDAATATIITEPKQGNLFTAAFWNGKVRLFDLRQRRNTSVLDWHGDHPGRYKVMSNSVVRRLGIVLGESKHFTSAR
jgi:regulator-associated protein of mTOR